VEKIFFAVGKMKSGDEQVVIIRAPSKESGKKQAASVIEDTADIELYEFCPGDPESDQVKTLQGLLGLGACIGNDQFDLLFTELFRQGRASCLMGRD